MSPVFEIAAVAAAAKLAEAEAEMFACLLFRREANENNIDSVMSVLVVVVWL